MCTCGYGCSEGELVRANCQQCNASGTAAQKWCGAQMQLGGGVVWEGQGGAPLRTKRSARRRRRLCGSAEEQRAPPPPAGPAAPGSAPWLPARSIVPFRVQGFHADSPERPRKTSASLPSETGCIAGSPHTHLLDSCPTAAGSQPRGCPITAPAKAPLLPVHHRSLAWRGVTERGPGRCTAQQTRSHTCATKHMQVASRQPHRQEPPAPHQDGPPLVLF